MNAAHLHLILNHVPVLGALATLALVALTKFKQDQTLHKLTLQFMVLIAILTLPVFFSGEPAEELVEHLPGVTESVIEEHERFANFAFALTELVGIIGLTGLYFLKKNQVLTTKYRRSIQLVALANAIVMVVTANLGGQIRHTEIRKSDSATQIQTDSSSAHNEK